MGKLYDEIKNDLLLLNKNKTNDFKSLAEEAILKSKINALLDMVNKEYKTVAPNNIYNDLSLKDIERLEDKLNEAEKVFNENKKDELLNNYKNIKLPNLKDLGNENIDEFKSLSTVLTGLIDTVKLQNNYLKDVMKVDTKKLIISARNEVEKVLGEKTLKLDNLSKTTKEYETAYRFINNPAKTIFSIDKDLIKFDSLEAKNNFINEVDDLAFYEKNTRLNEAQTKVENDYLEDFNKNGFSEVKDLEADIKKTIVEYYNMYKKYPNRIDTNPTLGRFLYALRQKVSDAVIEHDTELGLDKHSTFVKNYLNNPIDCMSEYLDSKIGEYKSEMLIQQHSLISEYDDINFEEKINKAESFKETILENSNNYKKYLREKDDPWIKLQDFKAKWFSNHFKQQMEGIETAEALNQNKGGFFEKLFGTTSKQYKDFSNRLENCFKDGKLKGDLDGLRQSAILYLTHKLKSYEFLTHGYDDNEINNLDETGKGRVRLALAVIDAIDDAKESVIRNEDPSKFVLDLKKYTNDTDYVIEIENVNNKNNQLEFQNNLNKEVSNDIEVKKFIKDDENNEVLDNYIDEIEK